VNAIEGFHRDDLLKWKEGIECDGVLTVWIDTIVLESEKEELFEFFQEHFDIEPVIVGVVETLPNPEHREMEDPPTGGRPDFFFYLKDEDVPKLVLRRFQYGMKWWQDVYYNSGDIYPTEFKEAYPWPPNKNGGE
tara:strand:+ start:620 stop:1024 length:405 start_codon:yes stop_codon:yes gene_type:complete